MTSASTPAHFSHPKHPAARRSPRAIAAAFLAAALVAFAGPARAQHEGESEVLRPYQLFSIRDVEALDDAVRLTPAQRKSVEDILFAAMREARTIGQKEAARSRNIYREVNQRIPEDDPDGEAFDKLKDEIDAKTPQVSSRPLKDIERDALESVRSVLTPAQIAGAAGARGWTGFEKHRSRDRAMSDIDNRAVTLGEMRDLGSIIVESKLGDADRPVAREILDQHQGKLDTLLLRYQSAMDAYRRETEDNEAAKNAKYKVMDGIRDEVRRVYYASCHDLSTRLSPEGRDKVLATRMSVLDGYSTEGWRRQALYHSLKEAAMSTTDRRAAEQVWQKHESARIRIYSEVLAKLDTEFAAGKGEDAVEGQQTALRDRLKVNLRELRGELRRTLPEEFKYLVEPGYRTEAQLLQIFNGKAAPWAFETY